MSNHHDGDDDDWFLMFTRCAHLKRVNGSLVHNPRAYTTVIISNYFEI